MLLLPLSYLTLSIGLTPSEFLERKLCKILAADEAESEDYAFLALVVLTQSTGQTDRRRTDGHPDYNNTGRLHRAMSPCNNRQRLPSTVYR